MVCIVQNLISRTSHIIALASCNVNLQSRCVPNLHAVPLPAAQGRTTPLPVKRTSLPKRHHASTREPRCRGGMRTPPCSANRRASPAGHYSLYSIASSDAVARPLRLACHCAAGFIIAMHPLVQLLHNAVLADSWTAHSGT